MFDVGDEILRAKARRTDEGLGANQARRTEEGGEGANQGCRTDMFRKSLRNANINYRCGWFFVTSQVAHNKSIFGAIVGEKVVLNDLGQKVWKYWQGLPAKYPELEVFESVLMLRRGMRLLL